MVFTVSYRTASAVTQRNPVLKNKQTKERKKRKKKKKTTTTNPNHKKQTKIK